MIKEKRKYPREGIYFLVTCKEPSAKEQIVSSVNISEGGLLLRSKQGLKPGSVIELCINFLNHPNKHICVNAEVVWAKKFKGFYKTGVKFVDMNPEDKNTIAEFIKYLSAK